MMSRSMSRNAYNQNNIIVSQNSNSYSQEDNRQTNNSDTTEDLDLANQMRAFQRSMLESLRVFQVTLTDTVTDKMTKMFRIGPRLLITVCSTNFITTQDKGQGQNSQRVRNSPDMRSARSDLSLNRPDRISNVISNWRIKFIGSDDDIACEDFIYRVNCVTTQSLNRNFDLLSQCANFLIAGHALSFH